MNLYLECKTSDSKGKKNTSVLNKRSKTRAKNCDTMTSKGVRGVKTILQKLKVCS